VTPTRLPVLAGLAVVAAVVGWSGARVLESYGVPLPRVPASAPLVLVLLGAILLAFALSLRSRLRAQRERRSDARPVDPLAAARAAMLAKATSLVGAFVVGIYVGYGAFLLGQLEIAPRRSLAIAAGLTALAAVALVASSVFLERVCRLPPPPDGGRQGDEDASLTG
jgi:hypothetical protein